LRLSSAAPRPIEESSTYRRLPGARGAAPLEPETAAAEASEGEIDDALRRLARARAARLERDSSSASTSNTTEGPRSGPRRR
jgi:hypothetical protein